MNKTKLLQNLRNIKRNYTYKCVAQRHNHYTGVKEALIMVLQDDGEDGYPIFVLRYRLDINFLASFHVVGAFNMTATDLLAFENAIKTKKGGERHGEMGR